MEKRGGRGLKSSGNEIWAQLMGPHILFVS